MKKYDNYKDSGIDWIGEIPEHWEIQRLKFAFDLGTGLSITKENLIEKGVPCVNYGEIHSKYGFEVDINKHNLKCVDVNYLNTSKKALMKQGEFIFADTSEDIEGSGNFTHIKSNGDIFAGYHTITARPIKKSNSLYFAFLFDSIDFRTQIRNSVKGIKVFSITQGILKDTFIWHPPLEEQTAIANYLDHKTTQIDTLIAKKEQFISLLQEERTAVINQAVTKGLDPKVKMKDSGIEWLGQIPEHWEVKKLKYVASLKSGNNIISEQITPTGEFPVYGGNGIRGFYSEYTNEGNYVLIGRQGALCGNINYAENKFWASEHAIVCYLFENYNWIWLGELLKMMNLNQYSQASAQPGLAVEKIKNLSIPVPTGNEQAKIVNYIKNEFDRIDTLISKSQQEIELLKEYKTALISEVVTGKVDVRDVVLN